MARKKQEKIKIPKKSLLNPFNFIATGFGIGLFPIAPGTFGTLLAIPIYIVFWQSLSFFTYIVALIIAILIAIFICERASRNLGIADHPSIVVDELVGFWVTMFSIPPNIFTITFGFILFRIFDIVKPWPISWCDKHIKGGVGIVLDDLIAGIFALILLKFIVQLTM